MQHLDNYSLALVKDNNILYSSKGRGLKPLIDCIKEIKTDNSILYDRVIGLAAARLVVYSSIIVKVVTGLASERAVSYLNEKSILTEAGKIVPCILNRQGTDMCPMEKIAIMVDDDGEFFREIGKSLSS